MKLKKILSRIPRPVKACTCAALVILVAIAYYIALGCPTTFRLEFRRAEKIHLVGPSKIVDTLTDEYNEFDKMIVGETENGICFFGRYYNSYPYDDIFAEKQYMFAYVEKAGDMTVAAAPNVWGSTWKFHEFTRSIPVYLFTGEADAVRAEIEMTVTGTYTPSTGSSYVKLDLNETFTSEADRTGPGVFCFMFHAEDEAGISALADLSNITGSAFPTGDNAIDLILATVRLYDAEDQLIKEETLTVYETAE